jgi:hypothetical protein
MEAREVAEREEYQKLAEDLNRRWQERKDEDRHTHPSFLVRDLLEDASREMEGFGVEGILDEEKGVDLQYVNMGDSYTPTIVFDHREEKFKVSTWADEVERLERIREQEASSVAPPVFYGARGENNDAFWESQRLNIECAQKLSRALAEDFSNCHLDMDAVFDDVKEYGAERFSIVLANTMRLREGDGRFSSENRRWGKDVVLPESVLIHHTEITSHSVLVDGIISAVRKLEEFRQPRSIPEIQEEQFQTRSQADETEPERRQISIGDDAYFDDLKWRLEEISEVKRLKTGKHESRYFVVGGPEDSEIRPASRYCTVDLLEKKLRSDPRNDHLTALADHLPGLPGHNPTREIESLEVGQRVIFRLDDGKTKLTGEVVDMDEESVTLRCGKMTVPVLKGRGTFTEAPKADRTHTKEYAKQQAQKHAGEQGNVFTARGEDATYKGAIVEITPNYAIQKVGEDAILHRLKDLEANKDMISEGAEVSIVKGAKGAATVELWNRERGKHEERDLLAR